MSDGSPPSPPHQEHDNAEDGQVGAAANAGEERRGYGIGTVSRLTGISTHTLRVWERRYGAVDAERSDSGRRLYSRPDIERLTVMKHLVDRGEPIGHVARLSHTELQERLAAYEQHVAKREQLSSAPTRTALMGETFRLMGLSDLIGLNVVSREADLGAFRADVKRLRPEALVIEQPTIDQDTRVMLSDLRRLSGATRVVLVYNFARTTDLQALTDEWTVLMRAPVTGADLARALRDAGGTPSPSPAAPPAPASAHYPGDTSNEIPARLYTREQLSRMATQSTTVECECPKHLVDLVVSLTAFESYSASCESRNPADAALHAYLHETTARSRELIEQALQRVVIAEGIDVDGSGS
ncbi:MAG: MerR family transcriptional regulator [Pseudomonadota bacterium]